MFISQTYWNNTLKLASDVMVKGQISTKASNELYYILVSSVLRKIGSRDSMQFNSMTLNK